MSIRNKVVALVLLCVLLMVGFAAFVIVKQQDEWMRKEAQYYAESIGQETLKYMGQIMEGMDTREDYFTRKAAILGAMAQRPVPATVRVFRAPSLDGLYGPPPDKSPPPSPTENKVITSKKSHSQVIDKNGAKYVELIVPAIIETNRCIDCHRQGTPGAVLGGITIHVPVAAFGQKLKKDRMDILQVTLAITLFMILFITSMLNRLLAKPISRVVSAAEAIAEGRISGLELKEGGKDDVGRLSTAFAKMTASLSDISNGARQMAGGDLSKGIDQPGELADAFNEMVRNLGGIVERIRFNSRTLGDGLTAIADIAKEQNAGAENQIKVVEGLRQTMNNLSQSSAGAAQQSGLMFEMAQHTLQSAKTGRAASMEGRNAVNGIAAAMNETAAKAEELKEKTAQIGKVLEIINDIAMETKILSVNASIEASKAGEMGKGFTVVAEEISKLAENVVQSTSAVKEINDEIQSFSQGLIAIIARARNQAGQGVETMKKTDAALENILGAANRAAGAAQKITMIARSQSEENRAVLQRMQNLSVIAGDFSRSAQKSADEADRIKRLFASLEAEVSRFRLGGGKQPPPRTEQPPPEKPAA